jgi:hypothetical protein
VFESMAGSEHESCSVAERVNDDEPDGEGERMQRMFQGGLSNSTAKSAGKFC